MLPWVDQLLPAYSEIIPYFDDLAAIQELSQVTVRLFFIAFWTVRKVSFLDVATVWRTPGGPQKKTFVGEGHLAASF